MDRGQRAGIGHLIVCGSAERTTQVCGTRRAPPAKLRGSTAHHRMPVASISISIDYHVATPGIAATAKTVSIYKDEKFSDHAPLIIDYDL